MDVGDYVWLDINKLNIPVEGVIEDMYYLDPDNPSDNILREIYLEEGYIKELSDVFCKVALLKDEGSIDVPISFIEKYEEIKIV